LELPAKEGHGAVGVGPEEATKAYCDRTRSNGFRLSEGRFRLGIRKKFFYNLV